MLDEARIKLMTKMAAYEDHEGKKTIPVTRYYKSDYISLNMVKAGLGFTVAYVIIIALWACYNLEYLLNNLHKLDAAASILKYIAVGYIALLLVYLILSFIVYARRYNAAQQSLDLYYNQLKGIESIYKKEERAADNTVTLGGTLRDDDIT